ncbi:MAG: TetR/AcrR family transcriptional regulator [Amnibacterium sp.]
MSDDGLGLREQKRRATRRALQIALLEGALDRGLENVTIEEVCRAAQVSPRTFFNYFASKEEAVAGAPGPFEVDDAQLARFVAGESDVLTDLVHLVAANIDESDDVEVHRLRRQVLEREPQLLGLRVAETQRFHRLLVEATTRRLEADEERAGRAPDEDDVAQRASLVVLTAAAVVRAGWSRWVTAGGEVPLGESVLASFAAFRDLAADAVGSAARPA